MNSLLKLAAATALSAAFVNVHALPLVDDFSVNQGLVSDTTSGDGGEWATQVSGASILGGYRDLYVEKTGSTASDGFDGVSAGVFLGGMSYSQASMRSGVGLIRWDGIATGGAVDVDGLVTDGAGVNLTGYGALRVEVLSSDANFPMTFDIWSLNGGAYTLSSVTSAIFQGPGFYEFKYADFLGANFADVGAIQLQLSNGMSNDLDITLDFVQIAQPSDVIAPIPEPGTLALLGVSLLGLVAFRRQRSKS